MEEDLPDVHHSDCEIQSVYSHNPRKTTTKRQAESLPEPVERKPKVVIDLENEDADHEEELQHKTIKTERDDQAASAMLPQHVRRKKLKMTKPLEQQAYPATTVKEPRASNSVVKVDTDDDPFEVAPIDETYSTPNAHTSMVTASKKEKERARIKLQLESIELEQESVGLKRKSIGLRQQLLELEDEDEC